MNTIPNRQVICDVLIEAAKTDKDIVVVCSDSRGSSSLTKFAEQYPKQFVEIGIAEQNLVTVSAGLASCGKKVFATSPACFLSTRSYEQVKVDVAYSGTNVTLIGVSGGVSYGALGMTHHSCQDIAAFAALPDMRVYLPSDRFQTAWLIKELLKDDKPAYIRVSRTASEDVYKDEMDFLLNKACVDAKTCIDGKAYVLDKACVHDEACIFGKACVLAKGSDVLLVACGEMVANAIKAKELLLEKGISAGVLDMYCIKPLDKETLINEAKGVKVVITIEEHSPFGGLGSMAAQVISKNCPKKVVNLSLPDGHLVSGTNVEIFKHYGLDGDGIVKSVVEIMDEVV